MPLLNIVSRKAVSLIAFVLLLCSVSAHAETDVYVNVTNFFLGTLPQSSSNRVFRWQVVSPFPNTAWNYSTSSVPNCDFYISNVVATTYTGQMLAPPSLVNFSFYVSATNLGVIPIEQIGSIPGNGVATFPSGQTAYSAQAADNRFQAKGGSANAPLSAVQSTNLLSSALPTNFWSSSAILWISNLQFLANLDTNKYIAGSGISASTNTSTGTITFSANSQTNGFSQVPLIPTNNFVYANQLVGFTNGLATAAITNGFVDARITNGVAFTNDVKGSTNSYTTLTQTNPVTVLYTNMLPGITNTFVTSSGGKLTNGTLQNPTQNKINSDNGNITSDGTGVLSAVEFDGNGDGLANLVGAQIIGPITNNTSGNSALATNSIFGPLGLSSTNSEIDDTNIFVLGLSNKTLQTFTNVAGGNSSNQVLIASNGNAAFTFSTSNTVYNNGTNFGDSTFVFNKGGAATNLFDTNSPAWSGTNISIGTYPVIYQSTNLVAFILSGTSSLTNSLYVWAGTTANYYTNVLNGGWITNNGSVWRVFSSAGSQLFHNIGLTGPWTPDAGTGTTLSDYGAYLRGDGVLIVGVVNSTNITTNIVINGGGGSATNAIGNLSGFGTNSTLVFSKAAWGTNNSVSFAGQYAEIISGENNNVLSAAGIIVSGGGNHIDGLGGVQNYLLSGTNNDIGGGSGSTVNNGLIVGGSSNLIYSANGSVIGGGGTNLITGSSWSAIGGGAYNVLSNASQNTPSYSVIPGGASNGVYSAQSAAIGSGILITNSGVIAITDPSGVKSKTNNTILLSASNGIGLNTNYANGNALEVLGTADFTGGITTPSVSTPTAIHNIALATNLAIGANTNFYQSTNLVAFYQSATSAITNSVFQWFASQGVYSNTISYYIITNNGAGTWTVYNTPGGSALYTSATITNNAWTVIGGGGSPATASIYGFYINHSSALDIGGYSGTNTTTLPLATNIINSQVGAGVVTLIRGTNIYSFLSFTNAYAFGFTNYDVLQLPAGTNYIQGAASGILQLPPNFTITGQGKLKSFVLYDTNFVAYTNNDVFQHFSVISSTLWNTIPLNNVAAFYTYSNAVGCNATGVVWDDVGITTWANGISTYLSNPGSISWTVNNCDIFTGQRGEYIGGIGAGSWTSNRNNRIYAFENTNQASVTIVALSLSANALGNLTNYIDNCLITADANFSTNAVEYIGIYASHAYTHVGTTFKQTINTNFVPLTASTVAVANILFEAGAYDFDDSTPESDISYNNAPFFGVATWPKGNATKLGVNELQLISGSGISISSNAFVNVPLGSLVIFDSLTNIYDLIWLSNHLSGQVPNQGISFDFSTTPLGLTNNLTFTNSSGASVTFWATNQLWVTNVTGMKTLVCSNVNEAMVVSNTGSVPLTAAFGSFQEVTNFANMGFTGAFLELTNESPNKTNVINKVGVGAWDSGITNITRILAIKGGAGSKFTALTNFWAANAPLLTRQKQFTVSLSLATNSPPSNVVTNNGTLKSPDEWVKVTDTNGSVFFCPVWTNH